MSREIAPEPLTAPAFAVFGDVLEAGAEPMMINAGRCERHDDLARLAFPDGGHAKISLFRSEGVSLPLDLDLLERHPLGSQAFLPASATPLLVTVAEDEGGRPGSPRAFLGSPGQGINLLPGIWHGVLTPLGPAADVWVVDRAGPGANLEEHRVATPWRIVAAA